MISALKDKSFLQLSYNLNTIRIYFIKNLYFISDVSVDEIKYNKLNCSRCLTYIMKKIKHSNNIDMKMYYNKITTDREKQDHIKFMESEQNGWYDSNNDIKRLILHNLLILQ